MDLWPIEVLKFDVTLVENSADTMSLRNIHTFILRRPDQGKNDSVEPSRLLFQRAISLLAACGIAILEMTPFNALV